MPCNRTLPLLQLSLTLDKFKLQDSVLYHLWSITYPRQNDSPISLWVCFVIHSWSTYTNLTNIFYFLTIFIECSNYSTGTSAEKSLHVKLRWLYSKSYFLTWEGLGGSHGLSGVFNWSSLCSLNDLLNFSLSAIIVLHDKKLPTNAFIDNLLILCVTLLTDQGSLFNNVLSQEAFLNLRLVSWKDTVCSVKIHSS